MYRKNRFSILLLTRAVSAKPAEPPNILQDHWQLRTGWRLPITVVMIQMFLMSLFVMPATSAEYGGMTLRLPLSFQDVPLKEVIYRTQDETGYYFLYRESGITGIRISLESDTDRIFSDLNEVLKPHNLELTIDHERRQVLVTRSSEPATGSAPVRISGRVVDARTGERLPYATIMWLRNGVPAGITANESGYFSVQQTGSGPFGEMKVSYIGYRDVFIGTDAPQTNRTDDLTIRLEPEELTGNEVVVTSHAGYSAADTLNRALAGINRFSPLGEASSVRALQIHPSIAKVTGLNNGLNVRGSTPDGFLVLLDGMSIFNQSHLFGLLDSFNADAIRSAGFYYGVTPAHIETPTGGTLNLITRTGSLNAFRATAGLSNTSLNGTFEGPVKGIGSWLISARGSYIDAASWFNNEKLIKWGLDIDRPRRIASDEPDFTDLVLRPGTPEARFYDIHGKFYTEGADAGRFIVSLYAGGDVTSLASERRTRTAGGPEPFSFAEVTTSNSWGNALLSLKYDREISRSLYSTSMAGISAYETDFKKDDFVYSRVSEVEGSGSVMVFTYPFRNRSSMNEVKLSQMFEYNRGRLRTHMGSGWRFYSSEYSEFSFDRPAYYAKNEAHLGDAFIQNEYKFMPWGEIHAGARAYYYSPGSKLYLVPRFHLEVNPVKNLRLMAGYSENVQFLHRVSLQNATTADVWTLSTQEQPPATAKQLTAGIEWSPVPAFMVRAEAYEKRYRNLRIHELNTRSLANTFSTTPWLFSNSGFAQGVELMMITRLSRFTLTQTYSLAEMTFSNPFLLEGAEFFAGWDRTHSYNINLETRITGDLRFYISWLRMSGAPNHLATFGNDTLERLDDYSRVDVSLFWRFALYSSTIDLDLSIFNLLGRDNVWYRDYFFNFDETRSVPRLTPVPVDVLDMGFQPSFRVQITF